MSRSRALGALVAVALLCAALALLAGGDATRHAGHVPAQGLPRTEDKAQLAPPDVAADSTATLPAERPRTRAAGLVRLSGRLVPAPLEWAWVAAVSLEEEEEEAPVAEEADPPEGPQPDAVVDAQGAPTASERARDAHGAQVGRPSGGWAVPAGATRVGADGTFTLELAPGRWVLLAGARHHRTRAESVRLARDEEVTWTLEPSAATATLVLTALAAGGQPLAGGVLSYRLEAPEAGPRTTPVGPGPWGDVWGVTLDGGVSCEGAVLLGPDGAACLELPAGRLVLSRLGVQARVDGTCSWGGALDLLDLELTLAPGERRAVTLRHESLFPDPTVVVTVRDPSGAPVQGAQVGLVEPDDAPAPEQLARARLATTGPDGRATFLEVARQAWSALARRGARFGACSPTPILDDGVHALEVVLDSEEPVGELLVTVLDGATGAPLASEVEPEGWRGAARRVGRGRFRLADVPSAGVLLIVSAPEHATRLVPVEVAPGTTRSLEVRLPAAQPLAGIVTWPAGPAGDAELFLRARAAPGSTLARAWTTRPEGRFRFDAGAAPGDELLLEVHPRGAFPIVVPLAPPLDDLTIRLTASGELEVLVLDSTGAPKVGEHVAALVAGRAVASALTGPDGRARLRGTPPEGAVVEVAQRLHPIPPDRTLVVRLAPPPGEERIVRVSGKVVGPRGEPVRGARVHGTRSHQTTWTGDGDDFSLPVAAGATSELCAFRADLGRGAVRIDALQADLEGVVIRIPAAARVRVQAPAAVTSVRAAPADGLESLVVETGRRQPDGAFDLGLVGTGRWRVVGRDALLREVAARAVEVAAPGPVVVQLP